MPLGYPPLDVTPLIPEVISPPAATVTRSDPKLDLGSVDAFLEPRTPGVAGRLFKKGNQLAVGGKTGAGRKPGSSGITQKLKDEVLDFIALHPQYNPLMVLARIAGASKDERVRVAAAERLARYIFPRGIDLNLKPSGSFNELAQDSAILAANPQLRALLEAAAARGEEPEENPNEAGGI